MRPTETTCLITGCALLYAGTATFAWGDLHQSGDRFVFVSSEKQGKPSWNPIRESVPEFLSRVKALVVPPGTDLFERRGVFILAANETLLNRTAREYLL